MSYPTTKYISLDIYNNSIVCINAKQSDANSRYIEITCTEQGKKIVLDNNEIRAYVGYTKPDGHFSLNDATVLENGNVQIELTEQMLSVVGKCHADVILANADGELDVNQANELVVYNASILSTMPFYINVLSTSIDYDKVESSDEYNALIHTMARMIALDKALQNNENERKDNEDARKSAETDRNEAEKGKFDEDGNFIKGRIQEEEDRQGNETIRKENEKSRIEKEIARDEAENGKYDENGNFIDGRIQAEDARAQAEDDRVLAENARNDAEIDREKAEKGTFDEQGNLIADGRVQAENARDEAENGKFDEDGNFIDGRVQAEEKRVQAENNRELQEGLRNQKFEESETSRANTFIASEEQRTQIFNESEIARTNTFEGSEGQRSISFENSQTERGDAFDGSMAAWDQEVDDLINACNEAETLRNEAENGKFDEQGTLIVKGRVQFEDDRHNNEKSRIDAEESRVQAEENRATNTSNAILACKDATQAANTATTNANDASDRANSAAEKCEDIISAIYPVGSIYMSINNVDPAVLFGGTWEQIKDTFLLAAGDTYEAGSTGGEAEHTLTREELPDETLSLLIDEDKAVWSTIYASGTDRSGISYGETSHNADITTEKIGSGQPHNNMPPYLTVYMWQRTA